MTYKKAQKLNGRVDGSSSDVLRWHQVMEYVDLKKEKILLKENQKTIVFLEFGVDEGVARNNGRVGAKDGAKAIANAMANFPIHFKNTKLIHGGIITCDDGDLEKTQKELAFFVEKILEAKALPIVLGGGHEIAYGHHLGIKNFVQKKKIGIINFDAHFDLRPIQKNVGATSGTPFWQIAKESENFKYLVLGIQQFSNTKLLFNLADEFGAEYVMADDFNYEQKNQLLTSIKKFVATVDHVYLTVCMDVFASAFAPGVSASAANGIAPDFVFFSCFDLIIKSGKLISLDIAETNPKFDVDNRTAKLAASLVFRAVTPKHKSIDSF